MGQINGTPNTEVGWWKGDSTGEWTAEQAEAKFQKDKKTIQWIAAKLATEVKQMNDNKELQTSINTELTALKENITNSDQATVENIQQKREDLSLRTEKGARQFLQNFLDKKYSIRNYSTAARMAAQTLLRKKGYFAQTEGQNYFKGKNKDHAKEKNGRAWIDGIWGAITSGAIRKFQEDYNKEIEEYNQKQKDPTKKIKKLIVDGKLGPKTIKALLNDEISFNNQTDINNQTDKSSNKATDKTQWPAAPNQQTNNSEKTPKAQNQQGTEVTTEVVQGSTDQEKAKTELAKIETMAFEDFKKKYWDPQNPTALEDLCKQAWYTSLNEYLWNNQALKNRIEALQKLSTIDENKNLTFIKSNYSQADITQRCQYAWIKYQDWIKNYQKLENKFQIIKMVNDATDDKGKVTNNQLETKTIYFKLDQFKEDEPYSYQRIQALKQNTLPIENLYQEDQNDLIGKEFQSIHTPRVAWLSKYQETRTNRINNIPNDLTQYLKDINAAFDTNLYDTNGKIKDENKNKVYIDNKDFVKSFILNNSSNNNLTNIKRITAKIWASANNKTMISWKEYKITLKGTTFTKSKLNQEQLNIVNWVLQSNHSQRTEIFAELCTEGQNLNKEKILWWSSEWMNEWITTQ